MYTFLINGFASFSQLHGVSRKAQGLAKVALISLWLSLAMAWSASAQSGSVSIMPLGDSITAGYVPRQSLAGPGYRYRLDQLLTNDGVAFTWVGSSTTSSFPFGTPQDTRPPNEGHPGFEIGPNLSSPDWAGGGHSGTYDAEIYKYLTIPPVVPAYNSNGINWLAAQPQMILLMIGTNDIWQGTEKGSLQFVKDTATRLSNLIDVIKAALPNTKILVASITPIGGPGRVFIDNQTPPNNFPPKDGLLMNQAVLTYNAAIPAIVASKGPNVYYVDMYDALTTSAGDLADNVHPTYVDPGSGGYQKMATVWFDAIKACLPNVYPSVYAINSGGNSAVSAETNTFTADKFYGMTGGTNSVPASTSIDVSGVINPAPQAVYQSERFATPQSGQSGIYLPFSYSIPNLTPNVPYKVRLHFAEIAGYGKGGRLFNVLINSHQVLTNFDIYANASGKDKAIVEEFNATADNDGLISVTFTGHAKCSGIEVLPTPIYRIGCGQSSGNGSFSADGYYVNNGNNATSSFTDPIDTSGVIAPAPQIVYQTERSGSFTYTIPNLAAITPNLPPVLTYRVRLHFAELTGYGIGRRQFNVLINNNQVLTSFDIYKTAAYLYSPGNPLALNAGKDKAIVEEFLTQPNPDGTIMIDFVGASAKCDGIEVLPATTQYYAIAAGGLAAGVFTNDSNFHGGGISPRVSTFIDTSNVKTPAPQSVYQTERWGAFYYSLPGLVPNANYTVRLHFAEVTNFGLGDRVINVTINGKGPSNPPDVPILTQFDIFNRVGGLNSTGDTGYPIADVEECNATADPSGTITVKFDSVNPSSNAKLSAIEVIGNEQEQRNS